MRRELGRTGVEIFAIGLGGMSMSIQGRPDERQSLETIAAALDAGVDFIDTADVYCLDEDDIGHNERLIGKALAARGRPPNVYVATKGGLRRPNGAWTRNGRPEHLRAACEQSLRALGVETIFLYQLHAPDPHVPFEDSVGALAELRKQGKIRHVGLSNVDESQMESAQKIVPIESVQNRANVLVRADFETGMVRACETKGVTFLAYSPVGGGRGHVRMAQQPLLAELAARYEASPYCIALAWLLAKGENVVPILGASRPASIRDSVKAVKVELQADDVRRLDGMG
jgi:aryl-alcohol dehydrogenase-like predicted oxidoreductase